MWEPPLGPLQLQKLSRPSEQLRQQAERCVREAQLAALEVQAEEQRKALVAVAKREELKAQSLSPALLHESTKISSPPDTGLPHLNQ